MAKAASDNGGASRSDKMFSEKKNQKFLFLWTGFHLCQHQVFSQTEKKVTNRNSLYGITHFVSDNLELDVVVLSVKSKIKNA